MEKSIRFKGLDAVTDLLYCIGKVGRKEVMMGPSHGKDRVPLVVLQKSTKVRSQAQTDILLRNKICVVVFPDHS